MSVVGAMVVAVQQPWILWVGGLVGKVVFRVAPLGLLDLSAYNPSGSFWAYLFKTACLGTPLWALYPPRRGDLSRLQPFAGP